MDPLLASAWEAHSRGRLVEASDLYAAALRRDPRNAGALKGLGVLLCQVGRLAEGADLLLRSLETQPTDAEAWSNLGNACRLMEKFAEGAEACSNAVALAPNSAVARSNLSACLRPLDRLADAEAQAREALRLDPSLPDARVNLAAVLPAFGQTDEAIGLLRGLARRPEGLEAHSSLLFLMLGSDQADVGDLRAEAERYGRRFAPAPAPEPSNDDRITVGFVSGDLRSHPVGFFAGPVLRELDRRRFRVAVFPTSSARDEASQRIQSWCDAWVPIAGLPDAWAAERIREQRVDVLIDLSGHTAGNRLPLFALKPAAVQLSWLGYSGTTGLAAIDGVLVDPVVAPPGTREFTETPLRLPSFLTWDAPDDLPEPSQPPCERNGFVTFGSFNNPGKISPATLDAWCAVLRAMPDSRLVLKYKFFADEAVRSRWIERFAERGVAPCRIETRAWSPPQRRHADFDDVDLMLDTFPYSGATTTLESLWMGVPVVTRAGDRYCSRMSASMLCAAGLPELACDDADEFALCALRLADSGSELARLRRELRPALASTAFCQPRSFARTLEEILLTSRFERKAA
ncbi:MAG: tetratricopeptide repeat protein [Fimbriimonadales bacterium]|nr:tetratricopeptide repeat protein [Fimbriimonadales bacterium]